MANRPYVWLSVTISIDGLINDTTPDGLPLSNEADFDRVDRVRAECDAILIGAGTLEIRPTTASHSVAQTRGSTTLPTAATATDLFVFTNCRP